MRPDAVKLPFSARTALDSIQGRLTAIALLSIVATAFAMAVVGFRFTVNFENERFRDHFQLLATNLAGNAELGVLLGNRDILQALSDNMLIVRDVRLVIITDRGGEPIIRRARGDQDEPLARVSAAVYSHAMPPADNPFVEDGGADQQVGEVTIGYTLAGLQTLKARLAFSFFILSLLLATLTAILYWRLSRAIRAPLRQVLHVAGEVSRGHLELRADGGHLLETATLARAFNDMLDALQRQRRELKEAQEVLARQRALAEVGKFSLTVAHEIKNPLAVIKGSIGILKKDGPVDPVMKQRLAGYLDEEIARINQLVEDFLIFARPRPPAFKQVPVGELLDSLTHRMQLMEPHIRIRNGVAPPSAAISVPCDPALLERSLLNLVRNALEAATAPPSVCVAFGLRRATLTLAVADDGPGFGGTDIDTLFEPFFSTKAKGTGLGLAIAREIVHAHGGTLNAAPRRTRGARFRIDLPLDPPGRPPP